MNHDIFKNPPQLMENMVHVTRYLREKILLQGGNPERETLNVTKTKNGADWYEDSDKNYWRVFPFIENSMCLEKVENAKDFYDSAAAFGNFQWMLADFPAETLHETIPNFHNTVPPSGFPESGPDRRQGAYRPRTERDFVCPRPGKGGIRPD